MDPARDRVDDYVAMARRKGLTISDILETHVHADHVSGNQALAAKTGARIHIHPAANAAFPHDPVEHGREIRIGNVALQVLHVPGHTPGQHRAAGDRSDSRHRALVRAHRRHALRGRRGPARLRRRAGRGQSLREPHRAPPAAARQRRGVPGPRRRIELRAGHVEQDRDHHRLRAALQRRAAGARRRGVRPAPHDRAAAQAAQLRPHHRAQSRPGAAPDRRAAAALGDAGPGAARQGRLRARRAEPRGVRRGPRPRARSTSGSRARSSPTGPGSSRPPDDAGGAGGGEPHRSHPRDGRARPHRARRDRRPSAVGDDRVEEPGAAGRRGCRRSACTTWPP